MPGATRPVVRSGAVDLTDDDRAIIYSALIWTADKLKSDDRGKAHAVWADKGKQAFDAEREGETCTVAREQHDRV